MIKEFVSYYLYVTVFITGASVLIVEILGTRVISPFYGSTIFVWSSLISVTLGALSLGYWLGGLLADKRPDFRIFYSIIFLAGIFINIIMKIDQPVLIFSDQFGLRFGPLVASTILFVIPLFLFGIVTPFAIRLKTHFLEKVGTRSGGIFAFSTLGSLVGAVSAGFILLPQFSLTSIFLTISLMLVGTATLGFIFLQGSNTAKKEFLSVFLILIVGALWIPKFQYIDTRHALTLVYQEQSFYGDLKIQEVGPTICLLINGTTHSCHNKETNRPIWSYILEIGRLVRVQKPESLLVMGLGAGSVAKVLPLEQSADFVEIDERVVSLAKDFFDFTIKERQRLFVDDARHFLRTTEDRYDMIIMDVFAGNVFPPHLFTQEYLEEMKSKLTDGGIILVFLEGKLPGNDLQLDTFQRTAADVFPSVIWTSTDSNGESFLLAHFSSDYNYEPDMTTGIDVFPIRPFKEISLEFDDGILLTDNFNPLDTIATKVRESTRGKFVEIQGYTPFFSL